MMKSLSALVIMLVITTTGAEARRHHQAPASAPPTQFIGDRYAAETGPSARRQGTGGANRRVRRGRQADVAQAHWANPLIYQDRPQGGTKAFNRSTSEALNGHAHRRSAKFRESPRYISRQPARSFIADAAGALVEPARQIGASIIGGRPSGCPHRFCGCALSIKIFGHSVRELWLAANWFRFPRAAPGPGMVAVRRGHVFQILAHIAGSKWQAYDPNSGGGRIRVHARSIAGYAIVNPRAGRALASL